MPFGFDFSFTPRLQPGVDVRASKIENRFNGFPPAQQSRVSLPNR